MHLRIIDENSIAKAHGIGGATVLIKIDMCFWTDILHGLLMVSAMQLLRTQIF